MTKPENKEKLTFIQKAKTYYSYNKYKMPIIFALIGMFFLTAFPGLHYEYWYRVSSKYNAIAVFLLMLLALVQLVNAINLSAKKSKKSEFAYAIIYTSLNALMLFLAFLYIYPYIEQGFQAEYLKSILVISLGMVFLIIGNVFVFIYLGYDTKSSINEVLALMKEEEEKAKKAAIQSE